MALVDGLIVGKKWIDVFPIRRPTRTGVNVTTLDLVPIPWTVVVARCLIVIETIRGSESNRSESDETKHVASLQKL